MNFKEEFLKYLEELNQRPLSKDFVLNSHYHYKSLLNIFIDYNKDIFDYTSWLNENILNLISNDVGKMFSSTVYFELISDLLDYRGLEKLDIIDSINKVYLSKKSENELDWKLLKIFSLIINFSESNEKQNLIKNNLIKEYYDMNIEDHTILMELGL